MKLFPEVILTKTEMDIIAENLSHPTIHKYLQYQIYNAAAGIAMAEPKEGETTEAYMLRAAEIRGMIKFAEVLMTIEKAPTVNASVQQ